MENVQPAVELEASEGVRSLGMQRYLGKMVLMRKEHDIRTRGTHTHLRLSFRVPRRDGRAKYWKAGGGRGEGK